MFAIYDVQGRRFRDTLESLRKVQAPTRSDGNRGPRDEASSSAPLNASKGGNPADHRSATERAVQAYRQTRNLSSREPIYHAHQIMTHPVSTLDIDVEIAEAWQTFQDLDIRQVPVTAALLIVGMLSLDDLLKFVLVDGTQVRYLSTKTVQDAMEQQVITADPVTDIRRIAQLMQEYRLHAVPIVDDRDVLVGIVSRTDILRTLANNPPLSLWT